MWEARREAGSSGPIGLDQLLALNEEIAALVRAGLPLGRGLLEAGRDVRGRLGRIAGVLGARLERGEGLAEALEAERRTIPPLYRAVVEAGARAGRLPAALEGLANYIRSVTDARQSIGLALWYPMIVVSMAYLLFVGLVSFVLPRFALAFESLGLKTPAPLLWLDPIRETVPYWWPVGPIFLLVILAGWLRTGTTAALAHGSWGVLRYLPGMPGLLSDFEAANFADLLALLVGHGVPYPLAMSLAGEASGSPRLASGAAKVAEAIERGEPGSRAVEAAGPSAFPPMLRWTLASGPAGGPMQDPLRHLADLYRRRGRFRAERIAVFVPLLLTLGMGSAVAAVYALAVFLPVIELLQGLSGT